MGAVGRRRPEMEVKQEGKLDNFQEFWQRRQGLV